MNYVVNKFYSAKKITKSFLNTFSDSYLGMNVWQFLFLSLNIFMKKYKF